MKRMAALVLTMTMLAACGTVLGENAAAERQGADLFDLYIYEEDAMTRVGPAVPLIDGMLVTPAAVGQRQGLAVSDGYGAWDAELTYTDGTGLVTAVFYDPGEHTPARESYTLPPFGETFSADMLYVRSGDGQGSRINRPVRRASIVTWQGQECLELTLTGPAEIGSAVLTDGGELAGLIAAEYGEGENRYIALTAESVYRAAAEAAENLQEMENQTAGPEGYAVTAEANLVTFDWSGMELAPPEEGTTRYLVVADMGNSYLNYFPAEGETSVQMLLTPGRTYVSGLTVGTDAPDDYPEEFAVTALPEAEELTEYGFRSVACLVAEAPEGGLADGQVPEAAEKVTEELLRSGRAYFYSSSVYDVEERIDNRTLLVTLTAPDGDNYRYVSGWVYDPAFEKEDTWFFSLEESGLLDSLNRNGYPGGVYELAFYVDGKLGDRCWFELP